MRPSLLQNFGHRVPPRWTCQQCVSRRNLNVQTPKPRRFSYCRNPRNTQRRGSRLLLAAASGTAAASAGAFVFADELQHYYGVAERSSRVVNTLYTNIRDYRRVLNHPLQDEEEQQARLKKCHKRCAERTLKALEKNGSIFIKLGQHLTSMGYLLPVEWTETFIPLQDKCPVSTYDSIEEMFLKDTGESLSDMFETFEREPIGSASLAQVHRATLKTTGQKVAVKVQHPHLAEWVPLDMRLTSFSFETLKRWFPEYDLSWLSSEMEVSLPQELDFALEGTNAMRAREYFAKLPDLPLIIPKVFMSKKRILVMDFEAGHRPDDLKYIDDQGIDRDEVSATLACIFNEMIFGEDAPLHCDPHGGNIAIRKNDYRRSPNFDVIMYDHGLYRDIPKQLKRDYAKLWLAVINSNEKEMRKYARAVAGVTDQQFPLFASAITGRDYRSVTSSVVTERTAEEAQHMSDAVAGLIPQLVQMLGQVPRIILLILKTNDLTRSLDENLHTREGPARTFLILARYCTRTVFQEQMETVRAHGSAFWPSNIIRVLAAWTVYMRTEMKLASYESYLALRRALGLGPVSLRVNL